MNIYNTSLWTVACICLICKESSGVILSSVWQVGSPKCVNFTGVNFMAKLTNVLTKFKFQMSAVGAVGYSVAAGQWKQTCFDSSLSRQGRIVNTLSNHDHDESLMIHWNLPNLNTSLLSLEVGTLCFQLSQMTMTWCLTFQPLQFHWHWLGLDLPTCAITGSLIVSSDNGVSRDSMQWQCQDSQSSMSQCMKNYDFVVSGWFLSEWCTMQ